MTTTDLTTVHKALADSVFEESKPGSPTSFRLENEEKAIAMKICENNGTKLSAFLRQCCLALVRDYKNASQTSPSEE